MGVTPLLLLTKLTNHCRVFNRRWFWILYPPPPLGGFMYCGAALAQAESLLSGILFSLTAHHRPPFTWSGKWGMVCITGFEGKRLYVLLQ